jgi:hypothetical protein
MRHGALSLRRDGGFLTFRGTAAGYLVLAI